MNYKIIQFCYGNVNNKKMITREAAGCEIALVSILSNRIPIR